MLFTRLDSICGWGGRELTFRGVHHTNNDGFILDLEGVIDEREREFATHGISFSWNELFDESITGFDDLALTRWNEAQSVANAAQIKRELEQRAIAERAAKMKRARHKRDTEARERKELERLKAKYPEAT